jgi:hypothetical protein
MSEENQIQHPEDEQKENNPFESPQTDPKPQDEQAKLLGDRLGASAYRIFFYINISLFIMFAYLSSISDWTCNHDVILWRLWVPAEVTPILVAVASSFYPASSRREAIKAILLSGLLLALIIWLLKFVWA